MEATNATRHTLSFFDLHKQKNTLAYKNIYYTYYVHASTHTREQVELRESAAVHTANKKNRFQVIDTATIRVYSMVYMMCGCAVVVRLEASVLARRTYKCKEHVNG